MRSRNTEKETVIRMEFEECPRCQFRAYEVLETHSYCVSCDYSPDLEYDESHASARLAAAEIQRMKTKGQAPAPILNPTCPKEAA